MSTAQLQEERKSIYTMNFKNKKKRNNQKKYYLKDKELESH